MVVKSNRIYFEDGMKSGYLVIEDGKFSGFITDAGTQEFIDYTDDRIIPGIFDTHNHGTSGYSLMGTGDYEKDVKNVRGYLKGLAAQGVTNIFPTAHGTAIKAVADVAKTQVDGATIVGIHSEGPWLNRVGEKGIKTGWPEVSLETAKKIVSDAQGLLKLMALAPEIPGIDEIIEYLLSEGIAIAYAHSDCNYQQALAAYAKGISVATHTGNVMTGLHHRDIGGLGAALTCDDVFCEVICDGMHICNEMLQIYFKLKDTSKFAMVSDCSAMSGAPVGTYKGFHANMTMSVTEKGFVLTDTGRLMGSSQPVLYGIYNLVENVHMPIETVLKMSSLTASKKYGFDKTKGSIKIGKDADFVVINDEYKAVATYANGRKVYDRAADGDIFNPEFLSEMKK